MYWSSADALVLKYLALQLQRILPVHQDCFHAKGHGGVAASRLAVWRAMHNSYQQGFVFRTDIRGYYRHIDRKRLTQYLAPFISIPQYQLLRQYLDVVIDNGGTFITPQGICRGCALSPLLGAVLLYPVDVVMSALPDIRYYRYMDDMLILASGRWTMRRARERLLQEMDRLGFTLHPDKTQVGRLPQTGFDWLGWQFNEGRYCPPCAGALQGAVPPPWACNTSPEMSKTERRRQLREYSRADTDGWHYR